MKCINISKHSASRKVVVPPAVRKFLKFCVESSRGFALHFSVASTPSRLRSAAWKRFCCLAVCTFTHQFVCPKTSSSYSCFMIWVCLKMECTSIGTSLFSLQKMGYTMFSNTPSLLVNYWLNISPSVGGHWVWFAKWCRWFDGCLGDLEADQNQEIT